MPVPELPALHARESRRIAASMPTSPPQLVGPIGKNEPTSCRRSPIPTRPSGDANGYGRSPVGSPHHGTARSRAESSSSPRGTIRRPGLSPHRLDPRDGHGLPRIREHQKAGGAAVNPGSATDVRPGDGPVVTAVRGAS